MNGNNIQVLVDNRFRLLYLDRKSNFEKAEILNKKTFVIGNGPSALHLVKELLASGAEVILATTDSAVEFPLTMDSMAMEVLTETKLLSCRGCAGDFRLVSDCRGQKIIKNVAEIVIAVEDQRQPNFLVYGLKPSSSVISQSRMKTLLNESAHKKNILSEAKTVSFLTGIFRESNPVITEEIMDLALSLQSGYNVQTYILTRNLKVAGNGLEALYRKTKETGAVYVKFTDVMPDIYQEKNEGIRIEFIDEITSKKFRLTPDITVVDETIVPSDYTAELAEILRLDADPNGFVQADNVHRLSVFTNRKWILAAGPSRSIQTRDDQITDAENVALVSAGLVADQAPIPPDRAEIDTGQCIRCLTCYRLCPYRAITLNARVTVVPDACERCGICAAQCPRGAVQIKDLTPWVMLNPTKTMVDTREKKTFTPSIVAFCCSRSAVQAHELARCLAHRLPQGLQVVEVPCSGAVSYNHIFAALDNTADGVMVLTCHKGNCHSEYGNIYASQAVEQIQEMFSRIGFEKERLLIQTLASNMGTEFARIVNRFEETVVKLGPSRLRKNQ